ncbi:MAG: hypothetical protein OEZ34_00795, partial [Spirochaetia bacterium]|nr:hypothetical protein [Spirochaetia bacterium]
KWGTFSKWSHVGMILKLKQYDFLTIWESTTLTNIKDLETGDYIRGVQLVPLSQRVSRYSGNIAVRQLNGAEITESHIEKLMKLRENLKGKKYESDQIELLKSAYDGPGGLNKEDLSSLFCSELVAEAYQALGLLDENMPSNEFTPADFSEQGSIKLNRNAELGKEILLK